MSGSDQNIFDATFALNQFSGNQSLLEQILEKFIEQYKNFDSLIAQHLEQGDIDAVKQKVHTIKGVSGNLGMKALHQACKELEANLSNQITNTDLATFLLVFKQTLTLIQDYSTEHGSAPKSDPAPVEDDKSRLLAALKRNEFISESKLQSYSQSLGLTPEALENLNQAIDNLDYTSAILLLE